MEDEELSHLAGSPGYIQCFQDFPYEVVLEPNHLWGPQRLVQIYEWLEEQFGAPYMTGGLQLHSLQRLLQLHTLGGRWMLSDWTTFRFKQGGDAALFKLTWA